MGDHLPGGVAWLANIGGPWLLVAFAVGRRNGSRPVESAAAALLAAVAAKYLFQHVEGGGFSARRYEEAAQAAGEVVTNGILPWLSMWARFELVEAAARVGDRALARDALDELAATTQAAVAASRLASRRVVGRFSPMAMMPRRPIARRSSSWSGPESHRARPCASGLRRVAAPRGPSPRGAPAAAGGRGDVLRDRDGGLRRARPRRVGTTVSSGPTVTA